MPTYINILFAEDHTIFRQLLIPAMKECGILTIGEAQNGLQLLDLLKVEVPDLLLLDIEMPEMNGSETFDIIRKLYPGLKIIFLTTHNDQTLKEYFYSKGASAYLTKDIEITLLMYIIRQVHENTYALPSENKKEAGLNKIVTHKFSRRESEMIPLILEGKSNKQIADHLSIGNKAVEAHKKNLFKKTKTESAVGFVAYLFKKGLNYLK